MAKPGDWVLVAPGDYHERGDRVHAPGDVPPAGVLIQTPRIHLRGMNRNGVTVDGTKPGSSRCSRKKGAQDLGVVENGSRLGRNGIAAYKASGVSIENLTVCNFLAGGGENGNEVWWNGGDGSGRIGMGAFKGAYLNATSTFYNGDENVSARVRPRSVMSWKTQMAEVIIPNSSRTGLAVISSCIRVCPGPTIIRSSRLFGSPVRSVCASGISSVGYGFRAVLIPLEYGPPTR